MMKQNKFLIIIFVLILLLPTFDSVFDFSPVKELFEKRKPVQMPEIPQSISDLVSFSKKFDAFFNDNYGLRKTMITIHSILADKIFDESPSSRVVIGKESWLFFNNYNSILDAQSQAKISDEVLKKGVEHFAKNRKIIESNGMDFLLIIAPDKASIYPEFFPDYIKPTPFGDHRIDKFLAALKKQYPSYPVLDLRPVLLEAKKKEIVYQQTDTHWNLRGAHAAYLEIMKMLFKYDQRLIANPRSKFKDIANNWIKGDISDIMGSDDKNLNLELEPKFRETIHQMKLSEEEKEKFHNAVILYNENKNLPRLFVYRDSFFADLINFISQHFSYAFYTNQYPCDIDLEAIKKYRPNIVVYEFWEGRIEHILRSCGN